MLITGTIFGLVGVVLAHILIKYYADYDLFLIFPILMALFLGFGLSLGARWGRCGRLSLPTIFLALLLSIVCYDLLQFLNYYYEIQDPQPMIVLDEYSALAGEVHRFAANLPYVSDYIPLPEDTPDAPARHLGTTVSEYLAALPDLARQPVIIGSIFDLALIAPFRDYLVYDGITTWDHEHGRLMFDEHIAQTWMLWIVELLLVIGVVLLKTRSGTRKAYQKRLKRAEQASGQYPLPKPKAAKTKKGLVVGQQPAPAETSETAEETPPKKKKSFLGRKKKQAAPGAEEKEAAPEKQKKRKWFGGKPKEAAEHPEAEPAAVQAAQSDLSMEFPEDEQEENFALILYQYAPSRQDDLLRLIQQVGQMSEDRARKLLKVPSLLKREVSAEEAQLAIEKFQQVEAQVKTITMEQLRQLQQKQRQSVQPAQSAAPAQPAPPPSPETAPAGGQKYALILKKFDPDQRKPVLELLSSLSSTPVDKLQQTLKTPALILRDANSDEVKMIAQQFQNVQAEVKILTMAELQKLINKK